MATGPVVAPVRDQHVYTRPNNCIWVKKHMYDVFAEECGLGQHTTSLTDLLKRVPKNQIDKRKELRGDALEFTATHQTELGRYENSPATRRDARLATFRDFLIEGHEHEHVHVWMYHWKGSGSMFSFLDKPFFFATPVHLYDQLMKDIASTDCVDILSRLARISFALEPENTTFCNICLRQFVGCGVKTTLCAECFGRVADRVARSAADIREELVQREFTGLVAGIVDKEGHDELIAKHLVARGAKRKRRDIVVSRKKE